MNKSTIRKIRYKIENNILKNKYSYPTQKDKAHRVCLKLLSIEQKIGIAITYEKEIKDYLKSKLLYEYQKKDSDRSKLSFRDLEKITGLNSKQLQRIIHENKHPHFDSLIKACQGLLDDTSKPTKLKKRRE